MPGSEWLKMGNQISRRQALKAAGASGMIALAGCSGESGDGSDGGSNGGSTAGDGSGGGTTGGSNGGSTQTTFTLISGPEGVLVYGVGTAMSATIKQFSDYTLNIQGGPTGQSLAALIQGDNAIATASAYTVQQAKAGEGRWEDIAVDYEPMQLMTMMDQRTAAVSKVSKDFQYHEDLTGTVGLGPAGASFNDPWKAGINLVTGDNGPEYSPTEVTQEASAISANRVDAQVVPIYVNSLNPSHIDPVYVENDVRVLSWTDENAERVRDEVGIGVIATPNDVLPDNIVEFGKESESNLTQSRYLMLGNSQLSTDAAYNMMSTLWENKEHFSEGHAGARVFTDIEFWSSVMVPNIPVHPGAAEFLQEHDVWNDDFEVGEI